MDGCRQDETALPSQAGRARMVGWGAVERGGWPHGAKGRERVAVAAFDS